MFRLIPPAGTPISFRDITQMINLRLHNDNCSEQFKSIVKNYTKIKHCYCFNCGQTALAFILKALSKQADTARNEVAIPAYTCFSVAAAIVKSGLKIKLVDIDPMTMDYDYDKLFNFDFKKVLAVVACNLFGIVNDWEKLWSIARDKGIFLIDDAAQSMGSSYEGKASGTLGDAGFYSLGRGKNISTYSGGIMLTNDNNISVRIEKEMLNIQKYSYSHEIKLLIMITLYSLLLKPRLYWIPDIIPFLGLGKTIFDMNFRLDKLTPLQACLGNILYSKLDDINQKRVRNSQKLGEGIMKLERYRIPGYINAKCPIYLRLPLLPSTNTKRDQIVTALRGIGISTSPMYPSTIRQISGIDKYLASPEDDFPGAQIVVDRLLTLPVHSFLSDSDIPRIISCLAEG